MIAIDLTCFGKEEMLNENIVSGIGTWISEILDYIIHEKKQGDYILLVDFYSENYIRKRFPGFEVHSIGGNISKLILKSTGKSTERYLKKYGFASGLLDSLVNVNALWFPFGIPEIVYWGKKKTIITVHDFMKCNSQEEIESYRRMLEKADYIVVISQYIGEELKRIYPDYCNKIVATIPNSICINMNDVKKVDSMPEKFILDINRYEKHKNAHTLLKAYVRLINEYRYDCDLAYVGFGNEAYLNELKTYAKMSGVGERVHFFWKLPAEEKNWLLKNATIFVSPSTNEGMGRTPVEAMMSGVPTLTTKETALYEATLGLASYCENPYDDAEMAKKIHELLIHGIDEKVQREISTKLEDEYSVENIWKKYKKIFDEDIRR